MKLGFSAHGYVVSNMESDIDVIVDFEAGANLFDWIGLALYLEEILGCSVDVMPCRAFRPEIREAVLEQVVKV